MMDDNDDEGEEEEEDGTGGGDDGDGGGGGESKGFHEKADNPRQDRDDNIVRLMFCFCPLQFGLLRPKDYSRVFKGNAKIFLPTSSLFLIDIDKRIRLAQHYAPSIGQWPR
jgi:hypothetical protein